MAGEHTNEVVTFRRKQAVHRHGPLPEATAPEFGQSSDVGTVVTLPSGGSPPETLGGESGFAEFP